MSIDLADVGFGLAVGGTTLLLVSLVVLMAGILLAALWSLW